MTSRLLAALLVAASGLATAGSAPAAPLRPELVAQVGRTAAVEGEADGGGVSLALSLLWPVEERFRVGVMAFADALGERIGRLVSPSGEDLGPVSVLHRATSGAAWRMEAHPGGGAVEPYFAATWGLYRLADDVRGIPLRDRYAAGFGLGVGVLRTIAGTHAAGAAVRFQQLSRGPADRYLTAALEWRWRRGATE